MDEDLPEERGSEMGERASTTNPNQGDQPSYHQNIQQEGQSEDQQSEEEEKIGTSEEVLTVETNITSGRRQRSDCFSLALVNDECDVDSDDENNVNIKDVIASLDSINDEENSS